MAPWYHGGSSESSAYLDWLAGYIVAPAVSICRADHSRDHSRDHHHLWSDMMGSEWLKMHQPRMAPPSPPATTSLLWSLVFSYFHLQCHPAITSVIWLTWSHMFDINLLTYFQICYCKDNIDILEEPWLAWLQNVRPHHVRDNMRERKWQTGRQR